MIILSVLDKNKFNEGGQGKHIDIKMDTLFEKLMRLKKLLRAIK